MSQRKKERNYRLRLAYEMCQKDERHMRIKRRVALRQRKVKQEFTGSAKPILQEIMMINLSLYQQIKFIKCMLLLTRIHGYKNWISVSIFSAS